LSPSREPTATQQSLVVSGTFTIDPVWLPLRSWLDWLGWKWNVHVAPYGQAIQQLLEPSSAMAGNVSGYNLLLIRVADWCSSGKADDASNRQLADFLSAMDSFLLRSPVPLMVVLCESSADSPELNKLVASLENRLFTELAHRPVVQVVRHDEMDRLYPVAQKFDSVALRTAHIPYSQQYYTAIASAVCRRIASVTRLPYKLVALDCDQTLWDGVCAEDGAQGVRVTPERMALQHKIKELRSAGLLICLCSKNQPADVWAVFEKHPDMVLRKDDISAERINWESKSSNLRSMARQLNLGLDSFIFIDDNPIECAEVQANCPEVLTVQLPHEDLVTFLDHTWALDLPAVIDDDRQRARRYSEEHQRNQLRQSALTLDEFLASLELKVDFSEIQTGDLERVAQLTQRTNQMNFTTVRRTVTDLHRFLQSESGNCFTVRVSDKFGDYGLVGAVMTCKESQRLRVDTFLLSCRALGRRVEKQMLRHLVQMAKNLGCHSMFIPYQKTEKNQPAYDLLRSLGVAFNDRHSDILALDMPLDDWELALSRLPDCVGGNQDLPVGHHPSSNLDLEGVANTASQPGNDSQRMSLVARELTSVERILGRIAKQSRHRPELNVVFTPAETELQHTLSHLCCQVMNIDRIGMDDPLKSLGLTSLNVVQILGLLHSELKSNLTITELFSLPTIREIGQRIAEQGGSRVEDRTDGVRSKKTHPRVLSADAVSEFATSSPVAVVGLAGRFPGAEDVSELWQNLVQGKCSIVDIPEHELNLPMDSPLRRNPNLVKRAASIANPEYFDAKFFGIFPKEAQVMDPQHRIMIECCWHALEDAGYQPDALSVPVGLFAGCYMDTYILSSLASNPQLLESLANSFHGGDLQTELGNDKDYLVTRVSYLLNLRGPAITVQTACSTSLVAIAQACQSLILRQCDMALAGGVTLKLPQNRGYLYAEGGMVSPDGVCRTFDAKARGTVFGEGAGVVVLKRLDDALADGDDIYAVIKGWGLNNDGRAKLGYTAPSAEGQFQAIQLAHQMAGITADSIGYMEAHGTGTALGDPIEVDALTRAFRLTTDEKQYCAIGSLKTNIGHLDVAAGVSGLIKVCLAMRNEVIPPSLQFDAANPNIDFQRSPFFVNTQLRPWRRSSKIRRAGLSSFGVGGTNSHIVIEEAPEVNIFPSARPFLLFPLSARSPGALAKVRQRLSHFLAGNATATLSDVAYTLQTGRKKFNYSTLLIASQPEELIVQLNECVDETKATRHQIRRDVPSIWMFPGQGAQYINMGKELYDTEPVFAEAMDSCFALLKPLLGVDLREKLFVASTSQDGLEHAAVLRNTEFAQPAIFCVSYSYAQWLLAAGVRPHRMVGHSVGEFVAACLGGVFTLADALRMVVHRARWMQQLPEGNMLAVRTSEDAVQRLLHESGLSSHLSIAAVNSPILCVVSGPVEYVQEYQRLLEQQEIACVPLHTSHAFHSSMMDPVVDPFLKILSELKLAASQIPIVSTVTGQLLSQQQACDPLYWARHLRETVRFSDAMGEVLKLPNCVLVEVGPGQTLATLARQQPGISAGHIVTAVSPHVKQETSPARQLWATLGALWQEGVSVDFSGVYRSEQRRRLHLPVYPFERQRYWYDQISVEDTAKDCLENSAAGLPDVERMPSSPPNFPVEELRVVSSEAPTASSPSSDGNRDGVPAAGYNPSLGKSIEPMLHSDEEMVQAILQQQLAIMQKQLEYWQDA